MWQGRKDWIIGVAVKTKKSVFIQKTHPKQNLYEHSIIRILHYKVSVGSDKSPLGNEA